MVCEDAIGLKFDCEMSIEGDVGMNSISIINTLKHSQ